MIRDPHRHRTGPVAVGAPLLLVALLTACGDRGGTATAASAGTGDDAAAAVSGDVTVFAAASLTDTFTRLGEGFMAANPDVTVTFSFAGSSALATQVNEGAPADVFAAASPATMQTVVDAGGTDGEPTVLVTNTLQIAVPPDNPGDVTGLVDLTDEARTIALCAVEVPCGAAAQTVFEAAGLTPAPDTLEQDVRAALSKVELGEVDAALVYRTDVIAAGDAVTGIDVPEADGAVNDYPIAVLSEAPNPGAAQAFVAYVLSEDGLEVLTDAGFGTP
ncbi:molybdate ABC transporter substrate-binding protein [Jannaschia sp. R86511]|uniref:molybdate ABC transporter substrate-binding protein n=1 Tax=Jannaschia sp. R86511 TaxID=3093853 RepID=UPI0036D3F6C6